MASARRQAAYTLLLLQRHGTDRHDVIVSCAPAAVTTEVALLTAAAEDGAGNGFSKAPSGLEWKDVREGTGPSPVSGALIRSGFWTYS